MKGEKGKFTLKGRPNPRQEAFLLAKNRYVAYGGARGGGKSWALRRKCILLALRYSGIRILLLRRTLTELHENHTLPMTAEVAGLARYKADERAVIFPNGSRIRLGYCDGESDLPQYQGQEYDVICIDEATQFSELQFRCLCACMRGGKPGFPKRCYLTCNPGGPGHAWVKRLFIDRAFEKSERPEDYAFIPARVTDNVFLMDSCPDYVRQLECLPEPLRRAWLDGDWNVFAGQFFSEFRRDVHAVEPFEIPGHWMRYYVNDYGLDMLAGLWIALSPDGRAYVYREIYESGLVASTAAKKIRTCESPGENVSVRLAPPDLWGRAKDSGKSIIEIFAENGLYFSRCEASREAGWMALREWLRPFEERGRKTARLRIFTTCPNLLRTLPQLEYDRRRPNDAATEPHELTHAPDALRYWAVSRPIAPAEAETEKELRDDHLGEYLTGLWN